MTTNPVTSAEDQQPKDTIVWLGANAGSRGGIMLTTSNGYVDLATRERLTVTCTALNSLFNKENDTASRSLTGGTTSP